MSDKPRCCASVWSGFMDTACGRKASVCRNGVWYCGSHDPVKVAERRAKRDAKMAEERKARDAAFEAARKEKAYRDACVAFVEKESMALRSWIKFATDKRIASYGSYTASVMHDVVKELEALEAVKP